MVLPILLLIVVLLAYANGANDNFKGVATLFGSGTTHWVTTLPTAAILGAFGFRVLSFV